MTSEFDLHRTRPAAESMDYRHPLVTRRFAVRRGRVASWARRSEHAGLGLLFIALGLACLRSPLEAQSTDAKGVIVGVVVDSATRHPLHGARVIVMRDRGVITDSLGRFRLTDLDLGDHLLLIESYGYESVHVRATAGNGLPSFEIPLSPAPMLLEGLTVEVVSRNVDTMDERFRLRRNAAATTVRALDQDRLLRSAASTMLEFLQNEGSMYPQPCDGTRVSTGYCVLRRGSLIQPRVYIDEALAIGGLDELATWRPYELYLVEVWSGGSIIRAYTHQFMERTARRPVQLIYGW